MPATSPGVATSRWLRSAWVASGRWLSEISRRSARPCGAMATRNPAPLRPSGTMLARAIAAPLGCLKAGQLTSLRGRREKFSPIWAPSAR